MFEWFTKQDIGQHCYLPALKSPDVNLFFKSYHIISVFLGNYFYSLWQG